jgi:RNA recognition motif-containing protein
MTNIYVGNLAYRATEQEIRDAFSRFGQVVSVQIIKDRDTGRSRGFAFVEMPDADAAREAIKQLDSTEIGGRQVKINEARPRRERY